MESPVNDNRLRDRAHKICSDHLGGAWSKISSADMSFAPVTGGMSNLLYCCSLPELTKLNNGEPSQVLLRLYGEASRNCDMTLQVEIFELLSNRELGPKLYGNFEDGRLEEFLPAKSLTCDELMNSDISSIIARKMAIVHSLDVPNMTKSDSWISDRLNEWLDFIKNHEPSSENKHYRESTRKIIKTLMSIDFDKEIKFLTKIIEAAKSPIVFSHNDLHQGNILLSQPTKRRTQLDRRVILIDFEYCSYNYRAFDIANHFSEWCFEYGTDDYPKFALHLDRFPSKEVQREFIRSYLEQQKKPSSKSNCESLNVNNNNTSHYQNGTPTKSSGGAKKIIETHEYCNNHHYHRSSVTHHQSNGTTSGKALKQKANEFDLEVELILDEVAPFCMVSNLFWALWCIKNAYISTIHFGYWEHAMTRWQIYSSLKQSYITNRTTKRIRTPLATTVANGHSISTSQLVQASPEVGN